MSARRKVRMLSHARLHLLCRASVQAPESCGWRIFNDSFNFGGIRQCVAEQAGYNGGTKLYGGGRDFQIVPPKPNDGAQCPDDPMSDIIFVHFKISLMMLKTNHAPSKIPAIQADMAIMPTRTGIQSGAIITKKYFICVLSFLIHRIAIMKRILLCLFVMNYFNVREFIAFFAVFLRQPNRFRQSMHPLILADVMVWA